MVESQNKEEERNEKREKDVTGKKKKIIVKTETVKYLSLSVPAAQIL